MLTTVLVASVLAVSAQTDYYTDMDQDEDIILNNSTALGEFLGGPCEDLCSPTLIHVYCKKETQSCECEAGFPVRLGLYSGCAKPVKLGDQCFYLQTCMFTDQNADCVQIRHNAVCQCKAGFHAVTIPKPSKRVFCSEDLVVIATDISTLLGVATGLAVLTALICFVLKLFVGARPRHYANSNLTPSILFDQTDTLELNLEEVSEPMKLGEARNGSEEEMERGETERSGMTGVSVLRGGCTRGSRGVLVPSSRAGAARAAAILLISCHLSPSHASVHSSTSSTKSFSARQYEREKENRLLARARNRERDGNSPSPRSTENLIDDPLPSETWPKEMDGKDCEAFTPDALERDLSDSMPHIDDPLTMEADNTVPPPTSPPPYQDLK